MCHFLLKFVLIAAIVRETSSDTRTVSDNEILFGSPMEVGDIPEYEIMQWLEPRRRENLRIIQISEGNVYVPVINEDNADKFVVPTKTSVRSKIGNYSITVETIPVRQRPIQNVTPLLTNVKPINSNGEPPLHRIIIRDEDIKPIIGVDKPVSVNNKPVVISKPATTVTKPAASVPKPATNIAKPASTDSKPITSVSKPAVGVKPATAISIKPAAIIKPIANKPTTSVNKPAITVSKPATAVNKPVTNSQKPVKQDPAKPTTPPAAASVNPCKCAHGQCMCCTGPLLDLFSQKACMKVIYIPEDFAFDYTLLLNKRVMYQDKISGKNPRPACISLPRFSALKLCAKFSNIYFAGRNIHMCLGLEGKWDSFELFSLQFDCLRMGAQGFAVVKPEEGGGIPAPGVPGGLDSIVDAGGDDIEDYDENVARWIFGSY